MFWWNIDIALKIRHRNINNNIFNTYLKDHSVYQHLMLNLVLPVAGYAASWGWVCLELWIQVTAACDCLAFGSRSFVYGVTSLFGSFSSHCPEILLHIINTGHVCVFKLTKYRCLINHHWFSREWGICQQTTSSCSWAANNISPWQFPCDNTYRTW